LGPQRNPKVIGWIGFGREFLGKRLNGGEVCEEALAGRAFREMCASGRRQRGETFVFQDRF
jgi:hypothetical protein